MAQTTGPDQTLDQAPAFIQRWSRPLGSPLIGFVVMPGERKPLLSIMLASAGLALYGLQTGGMPHGTTRWFGGQRDVPMEDGSNVSVWLNPSRTRWDVPCVAHHHSSHPPYTLQVLAVASWS